MNKFLFNDEYNIITSGSKSYSKSQVDLLLESKQNLITDGMITIAQVLHLRTELDDRYSKF